MCVFDVNNVNDRGHGGYRGTEEVFALIIPPAQVQITAPDFFFTSDAAVLIDRALLELGDSAKLLIVHQTYPALVRALL